MAESGAATITWYHSGESRGGSEMKGSSAVVVVGAAFKDSQDLWEVELYSPLLFPKHRSAALDMNRYVPRVCRVLRYFLLLKTSEIHRRR